MYTESLCFPPILKLANDYTTLKYAVSIADPYLVSVSNDCQPVSPPQGYGVEKQNVLGRETCDCNTFSIIHLNL